MRKKFKWKIREEKVSSSIVNFFLKTRLRGRERDEVESYVEKSCALNLNKSSTAIGGKNKLRRNERKQKEEKSEKPD